MRRAWKIMVSLGLVIVVLAAVWKIAAPGQLIKYKSDVDKTPHEVGTLTLYVDPATTAPNNPPTTIPIDVKARLHAVDSNSSTVVVDVDQTQKIGPLPAAVAKLQYVLDRRSLKDKADSRAFAYLPSTVVDRSPNYSIIFPLNTGNGPYPIWKDETGTTFPMSRVGSSTTKLGGLSLITMRGTMTNVPVQGYYIDTLKSQGIPKTQTITQLTPQLKAQGIDPALLKSAVVPRLVTADQSAINDILGQPVNLSYLLTGTTTYLVEPNTGIITSITVDQTLSVRPDIAGIGRIQTILGQSRYAGDAVVKAGYDTLAKLVATPPTTKVLRVSYAQTKESVLDIAAYAKSNADQIKKVQTTIPLLLLVVGLILVLIGAGFYLVVRRRPDPVQTV